MPAEDMRYSLRVTDCLLAVGLMIAIATTAIAFSGWSPWARPAALTMRPLPAAPLVPVITPVENLDIAPDDARKVNARVPLANIPNPAAKPFLFDGSAQDAAGAEACLAAAAYYEAGDDLLGQAAVVQVILNRVRHPAYPKSICGVILQGSERSTGCQFSFTCDGSVQRRYPAPAALMTARGVASRALRGSVFAMVGNATHYHADYVVPQWSSAMDKLLAFHSHLFFRWRGAAGDPRNFAGRRTGQEMPGPLLAKFLTATPTETIQTQASAVMTNTQPDPAAKAVPNGGVLRSDDWRNIYYVYYDPASYPGSYAISAVKICAGKASCTVYGWHAQDQIPVAVTEARPPQVIFIYSRKSGGPEQVQWDCSKIARPNPQQCIPGVGASVQQAK